MFPPKKKGVGAGSIASEASREHLLSSNLQGGSGERDPGCPHHLRQAGHGWVSGHWTWTAGGSGPSIHPVTPAPGDSAWKGEELKRERQGPFVITAVPSWFSLRAFETLIFPVHETWGQTGTNTASTHLPTCLGMRCIFLRFSKINSCSQFLKGQNNANSRPAGYSKATLLLHKITQGQVASSPCSQPRQTTDGKLRPPWAASFQPPPPDQGLFS